jgi:hypothetical protein
MNKAFMHHVNRPQQQYQALQGRYPCDILKTCAIYSGISSGFPVTGVENRSFRMIVPSSRTRPTLVFVAPISAAPAILPLTPAYSDDQPWDEKNLVVLGSMIGQFMEGQFATLFTASWWYFLLPFSSSSSCTG